MIPETKKETIKTCPRCKTKFYCKPSECWCCNLPEKLPMMENGDCFCAKCLDEILDKKSGAPM